MSPIPLPVSYKFSPLVTKVFTGEVNNFRIIEFHKKANSNRCYILRKILKLYQIDK